MDDLSERRHNGELDSAVSASGARASAQQVDDWLGETFEDDWGEPTDAPAERGRAVVADDLVPSSSERSDDRAPRSRPVDAAAARRAAVERRRIVAGLIAVTVLAAGVGTAVIIVRSGDEEPAATALEPDTTAPTTTPTDTSTTPTTTTPSDTSTTPTSPTTPSTPDTSSFTLPAGTKLRPGEDADAAVVTELQRALKSAGYDPGPIDGTYGAKTVAAVVALQQASGLSADGVVGPDTAAALNDALAASPRVASFTLPAGTKLRRGEDADAAVVTELQRALKSAGYDPGPIDGTYGAKTVAAVVALQQASGLSADGVVGPDTAAALNDALAAG